MRYGHEMGKKSLGVSFVVVRRNDQQRVSPGFFSCQAEVYGMFGRIGAGTCNDCAIVTGEFFGSFEQFYFFFISQSRGLAGGSGQDHRIDTGFDLSAQQLLYQWVIDLHVQKWCDQGCTDPGKDSVFHKLIPPAQSMPESSYLRVAKNGKIVYTMWDKYIVYVVMGG